MKVFICLAVLIAAVVSQQYVQNPMYSGIQNCVACLGSQYYLCDTNVTKFACYQNQSQCLKFGYTSNIYSKCVLNYTMTNIPVMSPDLQCQYSYLLTKDNFGLQYARKLSVDLLQNQFCTVQIINMLESPSIPGMIVVTPSNDANITYKLTNQTVQYFNATNEFDIRTYTWLNTTGINLTQGQAVTIIGSNPYTTANDTVATFEIYF